ncbi:pentapeptide repeat-containing protein [cf. Phormidesmis sp. LEGE 11477]|uniref:pentapeptide repeat-containing protein n=1 Tax=cf. Phormidesmis sp. LEGE 11477 TaxID=1828680 RepID=UPI00187F81C0|nr:pentapeptide repeat-containing protein [cf. Phormidesmis sp. LEGE 11477]MBE9061320.1 pentapeptide repeat-containing protein [cf. Phormidesmis sp. LEGE 11477]
MSVCLMHLIYIEIKDLFRTCYYRRGAFAVGTAATVAFAGLGVRIEGAIAADPTAIQQLMKTNSCPGCDLNGADFRRLDLSGADLTGADLEGANFYYANLDGAQLHGANLVDANLAYTSLRYAILDSADLRYAILDRTDLSDSSLIAADLRESYIDETIFDRTILDSADLRDTLPLSANFSSASTCSTLIWSGIEYRRGCEVAVPEQIRR